MLGAGDLEVNKITTEPALTHVYSQGRMYVD